MPNRQPRQTEHTQMDRAGKAILKLLDTDGPLQAVEIATQLDIHPVEADLQCNSLHDHGYIAMFGGGVYELTEAGTQLLDDANASTQDD